MWVPIRGLWSVDTHWIVTWSNYGRRAERWWTQFSWSFVSLRHLLKQGSFFCFARLHGDFPRILCSYTYILALVITTLTHWSCDQALDQGCSKWSISNPIGRWDHPTGWSRGSKNNQGVEGTSDASDLKLMIIIWKIPVTIILENMYALISWIQIIG